METNRLEVGYGAEAEEDAFAAGWKAAYQAVQGIETNPLSGALVFASASYDLDELLRGINSALGEVPVLGATTAGEICNGPKQKSVVVVALASPDLKIHFGVGEGISQNWCQAVDQAISTPELSPYFTHPSSVWSEMFSQGKSPFGLLFSPGNTASADSRSFEILEELKRLSQGRLPIMGGSTADDWQMQTNYVLCGTHAYPDSLLVAVFETRLRFGLALAHGFSPSSQRATVTVSHDREVLELDHQAAAEVYSKLLGSSRDYLEGKHLTLTTMKPAGILDPYKQYSINVASYFTEHGGVRFTQPVSEGTVLTIMDGEKESIIQAGQQALRKALLRGDITEPAMILVFSCALRSRILGDRSGEEIAAIRDILPGIPVLGFYSFGEQGLSDDGVNRHNCGVISVLALSRELSYGAQVALENKRLRDELGKTKAIKLAYAALEREVSDRKQAEKALRKSENKFRSYLEWAPLAIFVADREGNLLETNRAATELLGYDAAAYKKKSMLDLHPDEDREIIRQDFMTLVREGRVEVERRFKRSDGRVIWGLLRAVMMGDRFSLGFCQDITDRKHMEEALRDSEARYRLLADNARDVIWMLDLNLNFTYISPPVKLLTGFSVEEWQVMGLQRMLTPASLQAALDKLAQVQEIERRERPALPPSATQELEFFHKDGGTIWVEVHGTLLRDSQGHHIGFMGVTRDISARRQAEAALLAERNKFKNVLETVPNGVYIVSPNYVVEYINPVLESEFGPVGGRKCYQYLHDRSEACPWCKNPEVFAGKSVRWEWQCAETGKIYDLFDTPLVNADGSISKFEIFYDVTQRKRAEAEIIRQREELRGLAARLAEVEETERQQLARELHDQVCQNLASIGIALETLMIRAQREPLDQLLSRLADVGAVAEQTGEITRNIMEGLRPTVLDHYGLMGGLRQLGSHFSQRTGIALEVEEGKPDSRLEPNVELALFRIAQEALNNVAKHARASQVALTEEVDQDTLRLIIADNGIGFDSNHVTQPKEGRGWGLLTMNERATSVGGHCRIESQPGQGTRVVVEVPR